jgi:tripartite-type tricarboxylate transporter receptor subunit TctC
MTHIPYKGSGQGTIALLGGEIDMLFSTMPPAVQRVRSGKMRALAVTPLKRAAIMPELPTMNETLNGFEMANWYGMFFPAHTPREIITRYHAEMTKVLKDRDVRALMEKDGSEPLGGTPEEFGAYLAREIEKFAKVIKASGARAD